MGPRQVFVSADDRAQIQKAIDRLAHVRELPLSLEEHTEFDNAAAGLRDILVRADAELMTTGAVADVLHVSEAWVRVLAERGAFGDLSDHIDGTEWEISRTGFEAYLAGRAERLPRGATKKEKPAASGAVVAPMTDQESMATRGARR